MLSRRLVVLLGCILLLLGGCGPAQPAMPGTAELLSGITEPLKMVTDEPFAIALLQDIVNDGQGKVYHDSVAQVMEHLQKCINAIGWHLDIQIRQVDYNQLIPSLQSDMASGGAADGYLMDTVTAQALMKQQLTQDVGPVLQKSAPQLYDRIKALQSSPVAGIPTSLQYWPKLRPKVLYLQTSALQAYGKPIANATDLLSFLQSGSYAVQALDPVEEIMSAWAGQMGYYPLPPYGLPAYFYAHLDDPTCSPVPLEDIDGFDQLFLQCVELRSQNKLQPYLADEKTDARASGYINGLTRQMALRFLTVTGREAKEYTALMLDGCTAPKLDDAEPVITRMLAVPIASRHAGAVAAFAQWALASPDGYTLCAYGQQDVDYRLMDGRMDYLRGGKPLSAGDWDLYKQFVLPVAFAYHGMLFYSDELERPSVYGAANADDLIAQLQPVQPPIWRVRELRGSRGQAQEVFGAETGAYDELLSQRGEDIGYNVALLNGQPEFTPEQVLARIKENRSKLDPLILELSRKIRLLLQ